MVMIKFMIVEIINGNGTNKGTKISNTNKLEAHLRGSNVIKLKYQLLKTPNNLGVFIFK